MNSFTCNLYTMPPLLVPGQVTHNLYELFGPGKCLTRVLGQTEPPSPKGHLDLLAGEVAVAKSRLLRLRKNQWEILAGCADSFFHHEAADYAFEFSLHRIMGEPWVRPIIMDHLDRYVLHLYICWVLFICSCSSLKNCIITIPADL